MLDILIFYIHPNFYPINLQEFQLEACIYKKGEKQCGSWSAGFWEASWSGSATFSKHDIFRFNMVKANIDIVYYQSSMKFYF